MTYFNSGWQRDHSKALADIPATFIEQLEDITERNDPLPRFTKATNDGHKLVICLDYTEFRHRQTQDEDRYFIFKVPLDDETYEMVDNTYIYAGSIFANVQNVLEQYCPDFKRVAV